MRRKERKEEKKGTGGVREIERRRGEGKRGGRGRGGERDGSGRGRRRGSAARNPQRLINYFRRTRLNDAETPLKVVFPLYLATHHY